MKTIASITLTVMLFIACTSKESITPTTDIVGKWNPTYFVQNRLVDGTWEPFKRINTFVALPVYEFTADGRFLKDGKEGATVCFSGNKYKVAADNKITFTEKSPAEASANCLPCENWAIVEIDSENLILEECGRVRSKYTRQK